MLCRWGNSTVCLQICKEDIPSRKPRQRGTVLRPIHSTCKDLAYPRARTIQHRMANLTASLLHSSPLVLALAHTRTIAAPMGASSTLESTLAAAARVAGPPPTAAVVGGLTTLAVATNLLRALVDLPEAVEGARLVALAILATPGWSSLHSKRCTGKQCTTAGQRMGMVNRHSLRTAKAELHIVGTRLRAQRLVHMMPRTDTLSNKASSLPSNSLHSMVPLPMLPSSRQGGRHLRTSHSPAKGGHTECSPSLLHLGFLFVTQHRV
jgi:hypothetical protein